MTNRHAPEAPDLAHRNAEQLLCAEVLADAQREADELIVRARSQADEVVGAAQRQVDALRKEATESAHAESSLRSGFILAAVPLEQARMRASRIEELLEQLHAQARQRLLSREGFDSREAALRLSADCIQRMGGKAFVIALCSDDLRSFGPQLAGELRQRLASNDLEIGIESNASSAEPGVIVRDQEGRRIWDNRLSARLERMWPALRRELARRLGLTTDDEPGGPP